MSRIIGVRPIAVVPALLMCLHTAASAETRHFFEPGVPTTGFNRALGVPVWSYPSLGYLVPIFGDFIVNLGFSTVGAFDDVLESGNGNSVPLSPATSGDTLIATHFDPAISALGVSRTSIPDAKLNVPLDEVAVMSDYFGLVSEQIPCATETNDPGVITRAGPCEHPVTVDDWMRARGMLHVVCRDNGTADITAVVWNMRPRRMFTLWYVRENLAAGPDKLAHPLPFGGVPNVIVTDERGRAIYRRSLGYCPYDDDKALGIVVALRSNAQNYGGVPVPFLNQEDPLVAYDGLRGLIPGTTVHVQLSFNISGVPYRP